MFNAVFFWNQNRVVFVQKNGGKVLFFFLLPLSLKAKIKSKKNEQK